MMNFINKELGNFIVGLLKSKLAENDRIYLSTAIRSISDLERIGDYAENIVEFADNLKAAGNSFSETALKETSELKFLMTKLYENTVKAYKDFDNAAYNAALKIEDAVDKVTGEMEQNHIKRLSEGTCSAEAGAQYLSLATSAERVADHFINVVKTIKQYA